VTVVVVVVVVVVLFVYEAKARACCPHRPPPTRVSQACPANPIAVDGDIGRHVIVRPPQCLRNGSCAIPPSSPLVMFQTASRRLAGTAMRRAESINLAQIEAAYKVGLNVSRAQGVGQRGLLDGTATNPPVALVH
jgi:hypothetical protein